MRSFLVITLAAFLLGLSALAFLPATEQTISADPAQQILRSLETTSVARSVVTRRQLAVLTWASITIAIFVTYTLQRSAKRPPPVMTDTELNAMTGLPILGRFSLPTTGGRYERPASSKPRPSTARPLLIRAAEVLVCVTALITVLTLMTNRERARRFGQDPLGTYVQTVHQYVAKPTLND